MQTGGDILVSGEHSHMLHANQRISKTEVLAGQASFTENCTTRSHDIIIIIKAQRRLPL